MNKYLRPLQNKLRNALENKGMPEVLAFMAARNAKESVLASIPYLERGSAAKLLQRSFSWGQSNEGVHFWATIAINAAVLEQKVPKASGETNNDKNSKSSKRALEHWSANLRRESD